MITKRILFSLILILMGTVSHAFSGSGAGTEQSPYLITSPDELFEVRNNMSAYYRLENDIDMSVWLKENSPSFGWVPIGSTASSYDSCFRGNFDGNGKKILNLVINRENYQDIGLFGAVIDATIANIILVNPQILGGTSVGAIIGIDYGDTQIKNCRTIGGTVQGEGHVGGIIGYAQRSTIERCFSATDITGNDYVGGICGTFEYGESLSDCYVAGNVTAVDMAGGISGYINNNSSVLYFTRNYVRGNIYGNDNSCGIVGQVRNPDSNCNVCSNVCVADTIRGTYRISIWTTGDNYSNINTVLISSNGTTTEDNAQNGISLSTKLLQKQSTYEGLGWDFNSTWVDMSAYNEYPSHKNVSPTPTVEVFEAKSKGRIKGTTPYNNGTAYCIIDKILYTSEINDGKWEITLGSIPDGKEAVVFGIETGKMPSSIVKTFAKEVIEEPTIITGDANGDGTVDAVDVVSIVNYILGKPSSSFNEKNADINGDGQILVDDAVGTVNIIMSNQ